MEAGVSGALEPYGRWWVENGAIFVADEAIRVFYQDIHDTRRHGPAVDSAMAVAHPRSSVVEPKGDGVCPDRA